jgi:PTS system mannose-specific IIA component
MKITILVFTHGNFGREIVSSAKMIVGEIDDIHTFSLMPGESLEDYCHMIRETLGSPEGKYLALCDIYGGTPHHGAMALSATYDFNTVCGLNLGMLLTAVLERNAGKDTAEIETDIQQAARESVKFVEKLKMQNE